MAAKHTSSGMAAGLGAHSLSGPPPGFRVVWREAGPGDEGPARGPPLRVLVVDDDADTAESTSLLVRLWGHDARAAYGGAEALGVAPAYRPDVFLLDLGMPRMTGCDLARRLRGAGRFAGALLVAVTGYADAARRRRAGAAGFDRYLVKPVEPAELEALLALACGRTGRGAGGRTDGYQYAADPTPAGPECCLSRAARAGRDNGATW